MTLPGKGFWVGLVTGLILAGGYGAYALNQQLRIKHVFAVTSDTTTAIYMNSLRAKYEAGDTVRADWYHRVIARSLSEQQRYNECVAQSPWLLGGPKLHGCTLKLSKTVPEDWDIPGLDHARERLAWQQTARSEQPDTDS